MGKAICASHEAILETCKETLHACAIACQRYATTLQTQRLRGKNPASTGQIHEDCAAICRLTASLLAQNSVHVKAACRACAALCELCTTECHTVRVDQGQCKKLCELSSKLCRHVSQHMHSAPSLTSKQELAVWG